MRRWHSERSIMLRHWKNEMELHRYDWRNPPQGKDVCHCATGIGYFRKRKVARFRCSCSWCNPDKHLGRRRQNVEHAAITFELSH